MRYNEPLPEPPHRDWKAQGIALLAFIVIMTVVCVLAEAGVFRK